MSCYITYKGKNYTQEDFLDFLKTQIPTTQFTWARRAENSYEVSSKGDTRFSALNAKLKDGRTIEEAYQLDVKGYRAQGNNWRLGKGKAPLKPMSKEESWQAYKNLWRQFLEENPTLEQDLRNKASGKVLTDMFASTDISQARALAELLNERKSSSSTLNNPSEFTNHSGGAYGGDTMWDQIGREFGVTEHRHYRDSGNTSLSQKLRNNKVQATVLTSEQMEEARTQVEKLLGKKFPNTTQGNLQVRNYYQVANADAVYAIATLNDSKTRVSGGTNTAVQLGIKLNKSVYVWDTNGETWYEYKTNKYGDNGEFKARTSAPTLTKNFAGVGTRDIENYSTLDKTTNKWTPRKEYVGDEKAQKAQQAIRDVYEKTFNQSEQGSKQDIEGFKNYVNNTSTQQSSNNETSTDTYQYYGAKYEIITVDGVGVQVKDYKGSHQNQQKLLQAYNNNKDIDPQTGRNFRTNTPGQSTNENNISKYELFPGVYANEGQRAAIDAIEEFFAGDKDQFLLKGRGGTGKTTIVKKTLEQFDKSRVKILGSTISYEAKNVLQDNMQGYKTATLASVLGLIPDYAKDGSMFFREKTLEEKRNNSGLITPLPIETVDILIVDEASMIDEFIYNKLLELKKPRTKILFMGDNVQIPPINSRTDEEGNVIKGENSDSPVWQLIDSGDYVELSERMRQGAESPILPITDLYAKNVEEIQSGETGLKNPLTDRTSNFQNNEGVLFTSDVNEVVNQFVEDIEGSTDIREAVIVGARNAVVDDMNLRVRKKLFETEEPFVIGDSIRINSPHVENNEVIFENGLRAKVKDVYELPEDNLGLKRYELEIEYIETNEKGDKFIRKAFLKTISPQDQKQYKNKLREMAARAKSFVPKTPESKKAWKEFFDIKNSTVDVGYGYAITSHKVQGSTYNSAYVLEGDIMSFPGGIEQTNRMMYTAVSRPRKKLVIFNPSVVESQQVSQPKVDIRAKVYELFNLQGYMDIKTSHKTDKNLITAISHYVLEDLGYKTDQEKLQVVREGFKLSEYITTEQISDVHTRVRLNMKNIIEDEVDDGPVSLGGIKFTSSGYESNAKNAFTCK